MTTIQPTNLALSKATTSLTRKTMLVTVNTKTFSNSKIDPAAKLQMAMNSSAHSEALRVSKDIFDPRHLAAAKKVVGAARTMYYEKTLPWGDLGWRLLPTKLHFDFENQMRKFRTDLDAAVAVMDNRYDAMVAAGQQRLGTMAANVTYPNKAAFIADWSLDWRYKPVPASGHFVADIAQADLEEMRAAIEIENHNQLKETTRHLYQKIFDLTSHMKETLSDPGAKFKDSLVGNITKLTAILEPLNVAGDPEINALALKLKTTLGSYSPEDLRTNAAIRTDAATAAAEATTHVQSILGKMGLKPAAKTATEEE